MVKASIEAHASCVQCAGIFAGRGRFLREPHLRSRAVSRGYELTCRKVFGA